jgi:hypothetical protein
MRPVEALRKPFLFVFYLPLCSHFCRISFQKVGRCQDSHLKGFRLRPADVFKFTSTVQRAFGRHHGISAVLPNAMILHRSSAVKVVNLFNHLTVEM